MKTIKYLMLFTFAFSTIGFLNAESCLVDTINGMPVYEKIKLDINGDNINDNIKLTLIEDDYGWRNFLLIIDDDSVFGKHSYNVIGFLIIDMDTSDKSKEVAVYTPHANGPGGYIFYKYDNQINEIGKINTHTSFLGNGNVIAYTQMMFWTKIDTITYDAESCSLISYPQELYEINMEASVLEPFSLNIDRENFTVIEELDVGDKVVVIACDTSPLCDEKNANDDWSCDWYQIKTNSEIIGWVQLKSFLYKLDLPWIP